MLAIRPCRAVLTLFPCDPPGSIQCFGPLGCIRERVRIVQNLSEPLFRFTEVATNTPESFQGSCQPQRDFIVPSRSPGERSADIVIISAQPLQPGFFLGPLQLVFDILDKQGEEFGMPSCAELVFSRLCKLSAGILLQRRHETISRLTFALLRYHQRLVD